LINIKCIENIAGTKLKIAGGKQRSVALKQIQITDEQHGVAKLEAGNK